MSIYKSSYILLSSQWQYVIATALVTLDQLGNPWSRGDLRTSWKHFQLWNLWKDLSAEAWKACFLKDPCENQIYINRLQNHKTIIYHLVSIGFYYKWTSQKCQNLTFSTVLQIGFNQRVIGTLPVSDCRICNPTSRGYIRDEDKMRFDGMLIANEIKPDP